MKLKKNVAAKIIAICLAATMLIGICSASAVTAPKQNGISVGNPVTTAVHSASGGQNSKEETVYVLANADGSVQKIIVSDWLKNPAGANSINDISELDGIENVKGDEAYTMNPNNMRVWDAKGNDIYYQGTTQKALPVDVSISYQLDGKPISAEDLAGKSGRVTIRFSYQNNQKETIEIDGKKETVYVPFVMLTGAVLDNDVFSNVQISNGKLLSDGDRSVVMGFAMPGLQESLNLDKRKLEIPDYVELTADVKDFRLDTTLTVASNDIFNHLDLEDLDAQNLTSAGGWLLSAVRRAFRAAGKIWGIDQWYRSAGLWRWKPQQRRCGFVFRCLRLKQRRFPAKLGPGRAEQQQPEPGRRRQSRIRNFIIHRSIPIRGGRSVGTSIDH